MCVVCVCVSVLSVCTCVFELHVMFGLLELELMFVRTVYLTLLLFL